MDIKNMTFIGEKESYMNIHVKCTYNGMNEIECIYKHKKNKHEGSTCKT